jgi:Domain of unknown function (DUF4157)
VTATRPYADCVESPDVDDVNLDVEPLRRPPAAVPVVRERPRESWSQPQALATAIGNTNFSRLVARMQEGEGILTGGLVHPDVQASIAAARGRGSRLDHRVGDRVSAALGDSLSDVRVHTDAHASALTRAVSARAFTVGSDVFFAKGEYRPGTPAGDELITHELAHVVQQRGAPEIGPLAVSYPGDALERDAEAVAREVNAT